MTRVHPTAIVSPGAELGEGVTVGPYCIVGDRVKIGDQTVLESFVTVLDFTEIGPGCRITQNAVLGGEPQDVSFKGEESRVRIGAGVIIRENVTIHRGVGEGTSTVVGDGCFLMEGVHIGHNVVLGRNVVMANKVGMAGFSEAGDGAVFGGMAGVHQFVRVGKLCMIGGLSKIVKDVPPFLTVDGHPGEIYGLNKVGMRRAGYDGAARAAVKSFYDRLFRGDLPFRQALSALASSGEGQEAAAREIIEFCSGSSRGVTLWRSRRRQGEETADDQATGP
ncbi:MAG: acyl-ACP--UDP-N-acetylglucosamine O-acyltransferase [Aminivibrio sp.]|jgi:UDP-N-acetylglucosamine acyltransferase|nr:acyl-ACP--UDP-N-acetylglucosamine O-acyltransferase [Synergistaceae bacterium]